MFCFLFSVLLLLSPDLLRASYDDWPGDPEVREADKEDTFEENLSGLYYLAGADINGSEDVVYAVQNKPSVLFQLKYNQDSSVWEKILKDGKSLHYPDGGGDPDAEDITMAETDSPNLYVCTEQDNDVQDSRLSVLLFRDEDTVASSSSSSSSSLTALQEWDLTSDLKEVDRNEGLEAITWVPDTYLMQHGLVDDSRTTASRRRGKGGEREGGSDSDSAVLYDPSFYPGHGSGLFFVGLEDNGKVYAYALIHDDAFFAAGAKAGAGMEGNKTHSSSGSFTRITSFSSGMDSVMSLHFDDLSSSPSSRGEGQSEGYLWVHCDNTCKGHSIVFALSPEDEEQGTAGGGSGQFEPIGKFKRPDDMPDLNNEGFAAFPESRCEPEDPSSSSSPRMKGALWCDDSNSEGHTLRQGTLPCGAFIE